MVSSNSHIPDLQCGTCGCTYTPVATSYRYAIKHGQTNFYCGLPCARRGHKPKFRSVPCENCGVPVLRAQSGFKAHTYCSKGCAGSARRASAPYLQTTKGEMFARQSWQSARAKIQRRAKAVFNRAFPDKACTAIVSGEPCGYSKHVEVAHRRGVSDFPDSALITEINALSNLVGLCPNHHWEFDNGMLDEALP